LSTFAPIPISPPLTGLGFPMPDLALVKNTQPYLGAAFSAVIYTFLSISIEKPIIPNAMPNHKAV